jgi:hypothetical protein
VPPKSAVAQALDVLGRVVSVAVTVAACGWQYPALFALPEPLGAQAKLSGRFRNAVDFGPRLHGPTLHVLSQFQYRNRLATGLR